MMTRCDALSNDLWHFKVLLWLLLSRSGGGVPMTPNEMTNYLVAQRRETEGVVELAYEKDLHEDKRCWELPPHFVEL